VIQIFSTWPIILLAACVLISPAVAEPICEQGKEPCMSIPKEEIQYRRQEAARRLKYWEEHPEDDSNPEWQMKKILRGRAPDDPLRGSKN
jgi:hypothetical protein